MQPHDWKGRKPANDNPGPGDRRTKWLLLVIAILLGMLAIQLLWRLL
jgi:hypothetical protein